MTAYKTREATVKQRPKNPTISHNFSHEKTGVFTSKTPVFGGDKRDRTADLLNAIQEITYKLDHFFQKTTVFYVKLFVF